MDFMVVIFIWPVFMTISNAESIEEDQTYNNPYEPSTVVLQESSTNTLAKLRRKAGDKFSTNEEYIQLNTPAQLVEFHPEVLKISRITPPPKVIFNASFLKARPGSTTARVLPDVIEEPMEIIPVQPQPRGVLDVLFPAARVKSFKSVFDSVKRLLSNTFR